MSIEDDISKFEELLAAEESDEETESSKTNVSIIRNEESASGDRGVVHTGDTDSSDDEDKKNCFEKKYDDFGSSIKQILKSKEKSSAAEYIGDKNESRFIRKKCNAVLDSRTESKDVYADPVFGIRISNPLISGNVLVERMQGRDAINMYQIKKHVTCGDLNKDWVIAGVIVRKSATKQSQKGSQYCIWTLSDLKGDLKTVSVFLFKNAYKNLWKTDQGEVVGILNPSVLDKRDDSNDEACLSVDNPDRVMILGKSKDFGFCKSRKKNGEPCTSFVNLYQCQYCVYHVKREYQKCSRRPDLQPSNVNRGFLDFKKKILDGKKSMVLGGKIYTAPINKKISAADNNRLRMLDSKNSNTETIVNKHPVVFKKKLASQIDVNASQRLKDLKRLEALGESSGIPQREAQNSPFLINATKVISQQSPIGSSLQKTASIDFDVSYNKKTVENSKLNAIKWIKENGPLKKTNPNRLKGSGAVKKRVLNDSQSSEGEMEVSKKRKTGVMSEEFQKMLNATSAHSNLVVQHENEEQEKYFNKLELKESMEEKMLNTFKVACKAVKCLKCSYINFSASELCKKERHPLKVFDTFKRFFKCSNCNNRTTTLNLIPLHTCKNCQSSKWIRAPMINEKKASIVDPLSIRGEEEKFLGGGVQIGANINLLVPDS